MEKSDTSYKSLLEHIKQRLEYGDVVRIAERTGLEKGTIHNHLKGRVKKPNLFIIETALKVISDRTKEEQERYQKIETLISAL
jgi:hypothetical protein